MIEGILAFILGFFGRRLVGGGLDGDIEKRLFGSELGTQISRLIYWAIPVAILVMALTGNIFAGLVSLPLAWLGLVPGYWGGKFNLENKANRNLANYARLTARGAFIALPLCIGLQLLLGYAPWLSVAAGALFVPCYLTGIWLSRFDRLNRMWRVVIFKDPSNYGEGLLGGFVMLAIAKGI